MKSKKLFIFCLNCIVIVILFFVLKLSLMTPQNVRDWSVEQAILPEVTVSQNIVHIKNVRNFIYKTKDSYTPRYYDSNYNLEQLSSVNYMICYFANWKGPAHTFLKFNFKDGLPLVVSVEVRKEKGETFSILKGLINTYELMYVLGDENDVVKLRTVYKKDPVDSYSLILNKKESRELLLDMLRRSEKLRSKPEFYNSLTNNCLTNIIRHLNRVTEKKIPFITYKVILPGYSYELLKEKGAIS